MNPAPLLRGVEHLGGGGAQSRVIVGDDEADAARAAIGARAQEALPEHLGLRRAGGNAEHLAAAVADDADRDHRRRRDDPTAVTDLRVGRIAPQMGPFAFDRAGGEGVDAIVDLLDQAAVPELCESPEPPIASIGSSTERVETPFT